MAQSETSAANADQITYWNASAGETWAAMQDQLDRQIGPLGERAMAALAPEVGERAIDIGCGCGQTTMALAARVGPRGSVLGVDISHPMLEVARRRVAAAGLAQVTLSEADAQTHAFAAGAFDAVFSRFGVMFFSDPAAAFANIRKALRPGGRLGFVCWRPFADNPWMMVPLTAALQHLPPIPPPTDPFAPGPFALADADRLRGFLSSAGFADIRIEPFDAMIGAPDLDQAVEVALKVGPLGALLRDQPDKADLVVGAIRQALAAYIAAEGVRLPSATWIVRARAP